MMTSENAYIKYEHLFEGWPHVRACTVQKEEGMGVADWHATPDKLKRADFLAMVNAVVWVALLGLNLHAFYPDIRDHIRIWLISGAAFWAFISLGMYVCLVDYAKKLTIVAVSPNHIQLGDKFYDGRVQHKFTMDLHRKAKEEADAELRAQQRDPKRADTRKRKYYRDAYHIYFEYLGQRRLVADISREEDAEKFLRALNAIDRIIHKEDSVYAANSNVEEPIVASAQGRYKGHFGQRPTLD